jgi:hypothetical protein
MATQVEVTLPGKQEVHATSVDLSNSGARLKVPSAFEYNLGETINIRFTQLSAQSGLDELTKNIEYRILGVDDCYENDSIKWLRLLKLSSTNIIAQAIDLLLETGNKRNLHDNQDRILRTRTRGYEHVHLKNTSSLPLFFSGTELKFVMLTENNQAIWQYWHDERNQQSFGGVFNNTRMTTLIRDGISSSSNVIYAFKHPFQNKDLFYSLMLPEASREERQFFWHVGARKESWKVFRIHMYELIDEEIQAYAEADPERADELRTLTHIGVLVELSGTNTAQDYLLSEKPQLDSKALNPFRHTRKISAQPHGIYFDAQSRRREPRYMFHTPVTLKLGDLEFPGKTVNFSNRGLSIRLAKPIDCRYQEPIEITFRELQRYDSSVKLTDLPYTIIRIAPNYLTIQVAIEENPQTQKSLNFLRSLIAHNKSKLKESMENLPSPDLLLEMHQSTTSRITSTPFFVEKRDHVLQPRAIGVNFPLPSLTQLFHALGDKNHVSLEPILKNRTNTLLAAPMKPIVGAKPSFQEVYIAIYKKGDEIIKVDTQLFNDFETVKERITFIKTAKAQGMFYALRISGAPVFDALTEILRKELESIAIDAIHHARGLEKEFTGMVGYGEIIDITEEVLVRLEVT